MVLREGTSYLMLMHVKYIKEIGDVRHAVTLILISKSLVERFYRPTFDWKHEDCNRTLLNVQLTTKAPQWIYNDQDDESCYIGVW